jgi:hypothetical protein
MNKKELIPFSHTMYLSQWYDVVTADGGEVIIGAINTNVSEGHQVIGWLKVNGGFEVYAWNLEGKLYGWKTDYEYLQNLKLRVKENSEILNK